jgi:hypothetical protein
MYRLVQSVILGGDPKSYAAASLFSPRSPPSVHLWQLTTNRTRRLCETMSEVGAKSANGIIKKEGWQAELSSSGRVFVIGRSTNPGMTDRSDILLAGRHSNCSSERG